MAVLPGAWYDGLYSNTLQHVLHEAVYQSGTPFGAIVSIIKIFYAIYQASFNWESGRNFYELICETYWLQTQTRRGSEYEQPGITKVTQNIIMRYVSANEMLG